MNELKKKSLISSLLPLCILGAVTIFLMWDTVPAWLRWMYGPMDMGTVNFELEADGLYVETPLYGIYDYYCEEMLNGELSAREYIIDANDWYYMGLRVDEEDMEQSEALLEASYEYLYGDGDGTALEAAQYTVCGTIRRMPEDSLKLYKEYLDWDNMDADMQAEFLPYYLDVNMVGNVRMSRITGCMIVDVVLLIIFLILLFRVLLGFQQKQVRQYIKSSSNPEITGERVKAFLDGTPRVNSLKINREFICGQAGSRTVFRETEKLCWAYQQTTTHRYNFIPVSKSYKLAVGFTDGKLYKLNMKNESEVIANLEFIGEHFPHVILGYTVELRDQFKTDLPGFLSLRYRPEMERQKGSAVDI